MRLGVIADVHANLPALEAALGALGGLGVDAYACAGDLVGYGPQPNECVQAVERLGAATVAGNHDLIAIGELPVDRCEHLARRSLQWTRGALDDATRAYLESLPRRLEVGGGVVVAHGSLDDPQEYVLGPEQAAAQLDGLRRVHPGADILVLGHTHRALVTDGRAAGAPRAGRPVPLPGGPWVLNPGAVGQSREARVRARFMVLDLDRREATFHAVRYDVRRTRALLRRAGLPPGSAHLPPWRARAVLRPVTRATRSAAARVRGR